MPPTVGAMVRLLSTFFRRVRAEDGSFLLEAVVGAALLLTLSGGAILALDAASAQSGTQRARSGAANVASAELERVRSLSFAGLASLDVTRTVTRGDQTFSVRAQGADASAPTAVAAPCLQASRTPESVRITVTVTWPGMGNARPVKMASAMAAPAGASNGRGSLVVQVTNTDGFGVSALPVQLTGAGLTANTDTNGCVRFTDVPPSTSTRVAFSRPNYQTPSGASAVDDPVAIVANATQTRSYVYDESRPVTANLLYKYGTTSYTSSDLRGISWVHPTLGTVIQTATSGTSTWTSQRFPASTSQVGVYADTCAGANPPAGAPPAPWSAPVGGTVDVQLPTVDMRIKGGADTTTQVWFRSVCNTVFGPYNPVKVGGGGGASADWRVQRGMPYGVLDTCVRTSTKQVRAIDNFSNTAWPSTYGEINIGNYADDPGTAPCGW